jgi:hypothetical protein
MAVSGSKDYSITRTDIVNAALRKIGGYDSGETLDPSDSADAVLALNLMVKEWSARGIDLPWREDITVFLQPDTQSYAIGPTGDESTASYVETTLSAATITGATTISLSSTSGMSVSDRIGIKLDSGTIHWTTITNVAGTTINTGLASAAASGNRVYAYTTKAHRPQRVLYAHRRDSNSIDTPVDLIGEIAYRNLSNKGSDGPVNQIYYAPTLTNGTLYVWPAGGSVSNLDKLILIAQYAVDDFDTASNNPQFPIEWGNALIWNLAAELAPEYPVSLKERQLITIQAGEKLQTLLDYDIENASVIFSRECR